VKAAQLESEIAQVFGLLAVLLVFALAYFSAILPQVINVLSQSASNTLVAMDECTRTALAGRMRTFRLLMIASGVFDVLVGWVVAPLTKDVLGQTDPFGWTAPPTFTGLLLVDFCLFCMVGTVAIFVIRLSRGVGRAKRKPTDPPLSSPG
jgi:hypothetical protein